MRDLHPDLFVNRSGVCIVGLDIEPKAEYVAGLGRPCFNEVVKHAVNTLSTGLGPDIDALDPPKPAPAPVAPFEGDHQAADNSLRVLRNHVETFFFVMKHGLDAASQNIGVE